MENIPDPTPHLERFETYEQACREFRWLIPRRFNIAKEICRRHADSVTRIAVQDIKEGGINTYTFGALDFLSDKFANLLSCSRVKPGDSVAVLLPPSAELVIAHLGVLKAGAVVVQLSMAYGNTSFDRALAHSSARALVIDESSFAVEGLARSVRDLAPCFVVREPRTTEKNTDVKDFWTEIDRASSQFDAVETDAATAAFIFYIDQMGEFAGVVHSHRSTICQLAAYELITDVRSECVDAPAGDWSPPTMMLGLLSPSLWYGRSITAGPTDQGTFIQNAIYKEVYGRPETGWILGKCDRWFATPAGSAGRPVPGRLIEIIDQTGNVLPSGQTGQIAVHRSDPALFVEYHRAPEQTRGSFIGDWFCTGDVGYKNREGDFFITPK